MEIVVKGRNVEVPDHYRVHVAEKLGRVERYDSKIIRVDVELSHETNRRQSKRCQRVQITLATRGPAVRAEASAENFYSALDSAAAKLETRLRKAAERRRDRMHERTPITAVAATPGELLNGSANGFARPAATEVPDTIEETDYADAGAEADADSDRGPGRIVRVKDHPGEPITVDQALFQMELVGHDFYLFNDADTQLASVVYRRRGFDYGLLRLT